MKQINVVFIATVILLVGMLYNCLAKPNISGKPVKVANASFEDGLSFYEGPNGHISNIAHTGKSSLLLEKGYALPSMADGKQPLIKPGHDYRFSVWIKTDGCDKDGASVMAVCLGGPNADDRNWLGGWMEGALPVFVQDNGASPSLFATGGTHGWKHFSVGILASQINPQAKVLLFYLRHDTNPESKGKVYYDDIQIERLPKGTFSPEPFKSEIRNGGFENGVKAWGRADSKIITEGAAVGQACLALENDHVLQERIAVEGGKKYRISMKIRAEGTAENSIFVQMNFAGAGWSGPIRMPFGDHTESALFVTGGTFSWRDASVVISAPAGVESLVLYLRHQGQGVVYYDDLKIAVTDDLITQSQELRLAGLAPAKPTLDDDDFFKDELVNGDFKDGIDGWYQMDNSHLSLRNGYLEVGVGGLFQGIKLSPRKRYKISARLKTKASVAKNARIRVRFHQTGGRTGGDISPVYSSSGSKLENVSGVIEVPGWADGALFYVEKIADNGTAWFDNIQIVETDDPVSPSSESINNDLRKTMFHDSSSGVNTAAVIARIVRTASRPKSVLELVKNGHSDYRIHVGSVTNITESFAGQELENYIRQISGADLGYFSHDANPIDGSPLIVIGRNVLTDKLCPNIPYAELGDDGFVICTSGPHLVITGATAGGTLNGVFWLLDHHFGVRWFSRTYTYVPKKTTVTLKALQEKQVPRYTYRELFARDGDDPLYRAHNLLNGNSHHRLSLDYPPELRGIWANSWTDEGHNFREIIKDNSLHYGGQIKFMNEQTRQMAADYFIKHVENRSSKSMLYNGFSQNDNGFVLDETSQAFADKHGGVSSAPIVDMLVNIADRVRKVHPDAVFNTLAYQETFPAPEGINLPDYIQITVAPIDADFSAPFNSPKNKYVADNIAKWAKIAKHIVVWDYAATDFSSYTQPFPSFDTQFESLRWMSKFPSIEGYYGQASMLSWGADFGSLRQWVGGRVLWNPKSDWHALVSEFVTGYYGDAAPFVQEYINLMHRVKIETNSRMSLKTPVTASYLTFDALRKADVLFAKAAKAVKGQSGFEQRVATARIGVDGTILMRRGDYAAEAKRRGIQWSPDTKVRLERIQQNTLLAGITKYGEGQGDMKDMLGVMALERKASKPHPLVTGLPPEDWAEVRDMDFRREGCISVADDKASGGVALMLPGNTGRWGIQLQLDALPQKGEWRLYAVVRIDPGDGPDDANAISMGVYPPMHNKINLPVSKLKDGEYHTIELPGVYNNDPGRSLWFSPPNSKAVKAIYVDRVIVTRQR
jgi:hypothetical protein